MSISAKQMEAQHLLQVYDQLPIEPVSGDGVYIECDGRRLIDFYGGHAVAALGYAHPDMLAALNSQARSMIFQSNAVAMEIRARAADALADFAPSGLDRVFFVNSGAEANENALRMACKLTGRSRVAAVEHGFHGRTAAAGAVTWSSGKWYSFPQTPFDVDFIPRDKPLAVDDYVSDKTAAVIVELVQGVAGAYDLDPEFVTAIASACRKHGALLIIDEVQTGMGRSGKAFAAELYGVDADILTVAKSLAGGFPCGAVLCTDAVAAEMKPGDLGTTFGGGPLACTLIETVIGVINRDGLLENVSRLSARLADALPAGPVTGYQGKGFLFGLKCARPAQDIRDELLAADILVGTSADPNIIRLLPPLILEQQHVDLLIDTLASLPAGQ